MSFVSSQFFIRIYLQQFKLNDVWKTLYITIRKKDSEEERNNYMRISVSCISIIYVKRIKDTMELKYKNIEAEEQGSGPDQAIKRKASIRQYANSKA